jgi:hypothetical protein
LDERVLEEVVRPTLKQTDTINKQRLGDPAEFWMLRAAVGPG